MLEKDDSLWELLRNILKASIFIVIIGGAFVFMLVRKFSFNQDNIVKKVNDKKDFNILVIKSKCDNCKEIKSVLKKNNVSYITVKSDTAKNYSTILDELDITKNDIVEPSFIYVREGKVKAILVNIKSDELINFVNNYALGS